MNRTRRIAWLVLLTVALMPAHGNRGDAVAQQQHSVTPANGFVPDSLLARQVATVVLSQFMTRGTVDLGNLQASLSEAVWTVAAAGGVSIDLAQVDGRILRVRTATGTPERWVAEGFLAEAGTAARLGELLLARVYGQSQIDRQKPLLVNEAEGVWIVTGQLPRGRAGGVGRIELARADARVLRMTHGR